MSNWAVGLVWMLMYVASCIMVPTKKLCKGLFTRHVLKKILPPKRIWRNGTHGHLYRYWLWFMTTFVLQYTVISNKVWLPLFFGPIVLVLLDDYLFGDDDSRKRLWEGGKNKVKWLMDLPPEPVQQEVV